MAGQRKRLTKRKKSQPASTSVKLVRVSRKRKQWTNEQMELALKAVQTGSGINRAALDHGIPPTTLKDRLSGRVLHGTKPGPKQYLSSQEETELAAFLKSCASVGYGKARRDVMGIAQSVAVEKGILRGHRISQGWWRQFLKRQKDLSLRRGDNCAQVRMNAINSDTMKQYFDLLEDTMKEYDLLEHPSQIYNVDESGIPLDPKAPNLVSKRGAKKVRYRSAGKKGQITIVACGNAIGQVIPPMVIFDAKNLNHRWTADEVPGTKYGLSDKGWITGELFEGWLVEHFLEHAVSHRPLLLLLDGHSTHYQPDVIRIARENEIIMLCLPPHTTHETQPFDCGVFAPLKAHWSRVCHDFFHKNPGKVITKFNFNSLFSKAWFQALTPPNLIAGLKTCCVYPLSRSAISVASCSDDVTCGGVAPQSCASNVVSGDDVEVSGDNIIVSVSNACNNSSSDESDSMDDDLPDSQHFVHTASFDSKQELFQRRYAEGYNLCTDLEYNRWLEINHPEVSPLSGHSYDQEANSLMSGSASPHLSVKDTNSTTKLTSEVKDLESEFKSPSQVTSSMPKSTTTCKSTPILSCGSSSSNSSNTSLSKFLDQTLLSTPTVMSTPSRRPHAKVLTSTSFLAMLEEKEKKKQQVLEEREKNKKEREEKKKKRQEELEKRANEREEKKKQREEEKKKKALEKEQRIREKDKGKRLPESVESVPSSSTTTRSKRKSNNPLSAAQHPVKRSRSKCEEINPNVCCMCFSTYEEDVLEGAGIDWISCQCGRWMHEDCAEEREVDDQGKERFCPYCIV